MTIQDPKKTDYGKNYSCTIFRIKKNKPIRTFIIDTKDKVGIKYALILNGFLGKIEKEADENIRDFIFKGGKLTEKSLAYGLIFDANYRLLVTEK